jgi:hypothetical protein
MYIAIDPGKNVGVATFKDDGTDNSRKTFREPFFLNFLELLVAAKPPEVVFIMEDFKLSKEKALDQVGSDMPAPRMIGAVQMTSVILGSRSHIELVPPGHLRTSLKWAGYPELAAKPRQWHCPDDISAYAHGVKYLIDRGIRIHPIFGK